MIRSLLPRPRRIFTTPLYDPTHPVDIEPLKNSLTRENVPIETYVQLAHPISWGLLSLKALAEECKMSTTGLHKLFEEAGIPLVLTKRRFRARTIENIAE
jgi:AraC-like DNA-binding protein